MYMTLFCIIYMSRTFCREPCHVFVIDLVAWIKSTDCSVIVRTSLTTSSVLVLLSLIFVRL